jgi:hypothetical protein
MPLYQCELRYPAAQPARHLGTCSMALRGDLKGVRMRSVMDLLAVHWAGTGCG